MQVLLQTRFDKLKPDITTWTDSLTEPLKKQKTNRRRTIKQDSSLNALCYNYDLHIS